MKSGLKEKEKQFKIIYSALFLMLSLLSIWAGYAGANYSFLDENNSIKISTFDFKPSLSVRRIEKHEIGIQKYIYKFSANDLKSIDGNEFKLIVSKITDNAIKMRLNGRLISSEGDFANGRSMFKNAFTQASFELKEILDENTIEIETYSLYKTGIESNNIIISKSDVGMKVIRLLDFHGTKMVILSLGFLFFSAIFTIYIYIVSDEKDIALIYSSIATLALSIYFIDYVKIINLPIDYFIIKKILLLGLATGIFFYTLAVRTFTNMKKLAWGVYLHYAWYIAIMFYSKDLIQFKTLYEYWYFGLIANILMFLIYFILHRKKSSRIHIFMITFILLASYTSFVVITEFTGGFFSLNSPLLYITILAALPLMIGFDAIKNKEQKIIIEQQEKERVFLTSLEDSLTGAWNKRYFNILLDKISSEDTLAMIDFDNFKKINDSYGHVAGDYILKSVSTLILKSIAKEDELCRIGGDEFVIVFSKCSKLDALEIMEEIQAKLETEEFKFDHHNIKLTVSVGICKMESGMTKNIALKKLDQFLYEAKHSGKNTIKVDSFDI